MDTNTASNLESATPRHTTAVQILSGLFRTPARLSTPTAVSRRNKRHRPRTSSLSSTPSTPSTPSLPAVVLQTYSVSTDSIVLTALPSAPFCCHEDLLTMSRAQLEGVVRTLNARLPRRMRIGPEDGFWKHNDGDHAGERDEDEDDGLSRMSETEMKKRIEELVGIRAVVGKNRVSKAGLGLSTHRGVPPAPKAVRTRDAAWRPYEKNPWEMEVDDMGDPTDDCIVIEDGLMGSSPLASRTKANTHSRGRISTLSRLAILQEENEGSESKEDESEDKETRPTKRQRVSLGSTVRRSEGPPVVQEARESRLIENMDVSGSPLLAADGDASSDNVLISDEGVEGAMTGTDCGSKLSEGVPAPLQRRRSARIKELALKRATLVDAARRTSTLDARALKPSILRSKTLTSRSSSRNNASLTRESDATKNFGAPKEFIIRIPFTSTPPRQHSDSSPWSASRILRSRSQRLLDPSQLAKKATLRRSQSERYPRASDLSFVTINRPRYRFAQRKSKGTQEAKGIREHNLSVPASLASPEQNPQGETQVGTEHSNQESDDPVVVSRHSGLHTLPSSLCSFLTPRSRATSTSTVASTLANGGDSSARMTAREGNSPIATTEPVVGDGATERVSEALGRMAVEGFDIGE